MKILLKNVRISDPRSAHNGKNLDVLIDNGVIKQMGKDISAGKATVYEAKGMHASPGWIDLRANFRDPGHEYKEDLNSGQKAAARGGYAGVCLMPSTTPPIDNKSSVEYILKQSGQNAVRIYPIGCVSAKHEGMELAEMYDMKEAGAVAFSDDKQPIKHAGLLQRALMYGKAFNGLVMDYPHNHDVAEDGVINEGAVSTSLGMKGIPGLAEEIAVTRDLYLAEYCDAPIHIGPITTAKSVQLIREAKKKGIKVTCDTTSMHLFYTDSALKGFDTNFKLDPPLRTEEDRKALVKGVQDGTIDAISSDHTPQDIEEKKCEFENAGYGAINLQTSFALANTALKPKGNMDQLINAMAVQPGKIIGVEPPVLEEGSEAFITLFDPEMKHSVASTDIASKSMNSPAIGTELEGKVYGVIVGKQADVSI